MKNITTYMIMVMVAAVVLASPASAKLRLDNVIFDPAIVASGDEVDIIVQYRDVPIAGEEDKISDPDYKFEVILKPDDTLTENYVTIQDARGDDFRGTVYGGGVFNKVFRVKVNSNAPAGNYEFRLEGQWYENDEPTDSFEYLRFMMPVKKEGIIIDISTLETVPSEVRPGDNYVKIVSFIENTGEKDAKGVEVNLELPEDLESSYANDNRVWVGRVNAGERKEMTFFVDVENDALPGVYEIVYDFEYMDLDNNRYTKESKIPFRVKERPYLEVSRFEGEGLAGDNAKLHIYVKNTGTESAESVDVRLLKQNSQPFGFDVRSNYIGELEPDEEGVAIFDIKINSDAEIKEHDFNVIIRAKGDSDEGDDNIYTFSRRAKLDVTGKAPNYMMNIGIVAVIIVAGLIIGRMIWRKKK